MKNVGKISRILAVFAIIFVMVGLAYYMDEGEMKISQAAINYPDSMIADMQKLFEKDYFLLDVSNMRQQENGEGPAWSSASTLYYYNVTKGSSWKGTVSSATEGLTEEEKRIVRELRQSNIYCFHLTDADTDTIQFCYTSDNSVNNGNYYKTSTYKAGDLKGNLYAYLTSYTAQNGSNAGKRAYMIGKVSLPRVSSAPEKGDSEENSADITKTEEEQKQDGDKKEQQEKEYFVKQEKINAGTYSSDVAKLIRELWKIDADYFLLDTSGMNLSGGPDWTSATALYVNPLVGSSANWTTYTVSGSTTRETEILTELSNSNIRCWKIGSTYSDSDEVLVSYSNVWSTANGNDYYKTANYTVGEFRGKLYAYSGTCTISGKNGYSIAPVELPTSPMAGRTVYFDTGKAMSPLPKIVLTEEDGSTTQVSMKLAYGETHVYQYNFSSDLAEGVTGQFLVSTDWSLAPDTGFVDFDSAKPMYCLEENIWKKFVVTNGKVKIFVSHNFTTLGGATVYFTKNGVETGETYDIGTSSGIFTFDLASDSYDGFYIKQKNSADIANSTVNVTLEEIQKAVTKYGSPVQISLSGYSDGSQRTVTFSEYISPGDQSLNIPVGTFKKEDNVLYVNATFYDYYSDYALQGKNRKELSGAMGANGSDNKWQCKKFNSAIEAYFKDTTLASSAWQSPLYFGEFYGTSPTLLNFKYNNNNLSDNGGARIGLVNDKLVNDKLVMGTDNVIVPYFDADFLRGNNSLGDNIGYVFENVSFPFIKNSEGYWEFNSYDSSETLRMTQTKDGEYFLNRVGSSNSVYGHTSSAVTMDSNFFPFNDKSESGDPIKLNYGFGARIDIPFYMTSDGRVQIDAETGKDITFTFSGDDDIWIFIDGKLVLDIGGDHGAVDGTINFATCEATTTGTRLKSGTTSTGEKGTFVTNFDRLNSTDQHTLSLFYMERGLWESNMKITFNFPQSNNLNVEKEVIVTEDVNPVFQSAVDKLTGSADGTVAASVAFPISIQNMVTSGVSFDIVGASTPLEKIFDEITSASSAGIYPNGSAATEIITSNIPGEDGRTCVLKYSCPGEKNYKEGQEVTDKRSILINYPQNTTGLSLDDAEATRIKENGYLEFDVYLEATTGGGSPFLALVDGSGNRIGAWAVEAVYSGTNGNMSAGKWVTLRMYLSKLKALDSGTFDYACIKQVQFAYWDSKTIYIDNISLKAPAIYTSASGFEKEQDKIPDYGSVNSRQLMPVNGAEHSLTGNTEKSYVDNGAIYLKNKQTALFADQFRRNSYLSIIEECDTDVFDVKWTIMEDGQAVKGGNGTAVEDGRTAQNTSPAGIAKPDGSTMLFRTWDAQANSTKFYDLGVKFTNTLKTGSLKIKKQVTNKKAHQIDQNALIDVEIPYTIKVTFTNIAGLSLERDMNDYESDYSVSIDKSIYLKDGSDVAIITGIPAGTEYRIEEIQVADDSVPLMAAGLTRDDFVLDTIEGNDANAYFDEESKSYRGTITANTQAEVKVINDINPVTDETNMTGEKLWKLVEDGESKHGNTKLETPPEAKSVMLKLQRRFVKGTGDDDVTYAYEDVTYDGTNPITINLQQGKTTENDTKCFNYYYKSVDESSGEILSYQTDVTVKTDGWKYSVEGLPLYGMVTGRSEEGSNVDSKKGRRRKYEYRFVETQMVTKDGEEERTIVVEFDEQKGYLENSSGFTTTGGTFHTTTVDGKEVIDYDITNVYDPATDLQITKVTGDDNQPMDGVTFELVRLVKDERGELVEDETFNKNTGSRVGTTGDGSGTLTFNNLPDGTYRLTEIKTVAGYSLLAKPIQLVINHAEGTTVEGTHYPLDVTGKLIQITISNQGLLELPMTGSRGRYLVIAFGIFLILSGEAFYLWNMYHQNRIRHRKK